MKHQPTPHQRIRGCLYLLLVAVFFLLAVGGPVYWVDYHYGRQRALLLLGVIILFHRSYWPGLFKIISRFNPNLYITMGLRLVTDEIAQKMLLAYLPQRVDLYYLALRLLPHNGHSTLWAILQSELGRRLVRTSQGSQAENIERAILAYQNALRVITPQKMPFDWTTIMMNQAIAYSKRIRGDHAVNMEQAIHYSQQALSIVTPEDYPEGWAGIQDTLGTFYATRIMGERADNQEKAIHHLRQALSVYREETHRNQWADGHANLGYVYIHRTVGNQVENIEQAIIHFNNALYGYLGSFPLADMARVQIGLGIAYAKRVYEGRADNLEKATHHFEQALTTFTLETFPYQWASLQLNLGHVYSDRIKGEHGANIEKAISYYQQAGYVFSLKEYPLDWAMLQNNLAIAYYERIYGEREQNLKQAIFHYQQAQTVYRVDELPAQYFLIQRNLGELLFNTSCWAEAELVYEEAIRVGEMLFDTAFTEGGRRAEVFAAAQVYVYLAYCKLQQNKTDEALLTLERGKTRIMTQTLSLTVPNLSQLSVEQQQTIRQTRQIIRDLENKLRQKAELPGQRNDRPALSTPFPLQLWERSKSLGDEDERILSEQLRQARIDLNQLIQTIRIEQPDFMQTRQELNELLALIPMGGALVAPFFTSRGSGAFVVPFGNVSITQDHILSLPHITASHLDVMLSGSEDGVGWLLAYLERANVAQWLSKIDFFTNRLWPLLMGPIFDRLQALGLTKGTPILIMPQGGLGVLPLHAAWRDVAGQPRSFLDDYLVIYAPSGYSLHISHRHLAQHRGQERTLCAIVNPTHDLKYAQLEGENISILFDPNHQRQLIATEATADTFHEALVGYTYVHYAGHGYYNWRNPMQSGLMFWDKVVTLSDILSQLDLNACRLVVLSACETGLSDINQSPDEYVGLTTGFLQAGAPAVISALWAVNDLSTMLLMERFYQLHLRDGLDIASALRHAQLWLRDITAGELAERFGKAFRERERKRLEQMEARDYWRRFAAMEPEERPFSHPYYWAAFTFTGA